jgi:hypothetical protein
MHRLASFSVSERLFALAARALAALVGMAPLGHRSGRARSKRVRAFIENDLAMVHRLGELRAGPANALWFEQDMFLNVTAASALGARAEQMMDGMRVFRIAGAHPAPVLVTAPHAA